MLTRFKNIENYMQSDEGREDPYLLTQVVTRMGGTFVNGQSQSAVSAYAEAPGGFSIRFLFDPITAHAEGEKVGQGTYLVTLLKDGTVQRQLNYRRV